jgi:flagellar protein FliO/FliZ
MCKLSKIIVSEFVVLVSTILFSVNLYAIDKSTAESIVTNSSKTKALSAGSGMSDPNMAGNLVQTTLGLLVVLLLIGAAAWAFKRFGNIHVGAQGRMKIIGGISLGARERAVLLQVGEQQIVLGVSPGRVQTLHVLDKPVQVEEKPADPMSFSSRLQSAILSRKNTVDEGGQK